MSENTSPHIEAAISDTFRQERGRLLAFIRSKLPEPAEAEDLLQDVFFQFVAHYDEIVSLDRVTSWLFSVARNRITDTYRKQRPQRLDSEGALTLAEILPDLSGHPEQAYLRSLLLDTLDSALESLPAEQRDVFVQHEFEGRSFKDLAQSTGIPINTLLSRKRYAVLHLREQLQTLYDEWNL
ncbi:MAG: sigma-70 family RNA polymerase sigma factor SigL [Bacteroidia bacterium]